jgi:hypothetical protein
LQTCARSSQCVEPARTTCELAAWLVLAQDFRQVDMTLVGTQWDSLLPTLESSGYLLWRVVSTTHTTPGGYSLLSHYSLPGGVLTTLPLLTTRRGTQYSQLGGYSLLSHYSPPGGHSLLIHSSPQVGTRYSFTTLPRWILTTLSLLSTGGYSLRKLLSESHRSTKSLRVSTVNIIRVMPTDMWMMVNIRYI